MPSVYVAASLLISVEQTHQMASMGGVGNESNAKRSSSMSIVKVEVHTVNAPR